jgi:Family of unknown function (DUF6545)
LELAIAAVSWLVTAWRLPSARQEPWKRALWAAFAALALAVTFGLSPIAAAVDRATGVTDLATLLKHLSGVAACAAVTNWVSALAPSPPGGGRRRRPARWAVTAVTVATLVVLFAITPRREAAGFTDTMAGQPAATAYLLVFESYLGTAMAPATVLFARAARQAGPGLLRWGLRLLTTGTASSAACAVARCAMLVTAVAGGAVPGGTGRAAGAAGVLQAAAILLILAGTSLPAAPVAARTAHDYRALHDLRPLWSRLTAAAPHIVLGPPPARLDDLRALGADLRPRLGRRIVEIRDAALLLRGHVSDASAASARDALAAAGLAGEELDAAAEAAWLRAATAARLAGCPPAHPPPARPLHGGTDITAEARWLRLVARAWDRPATVRAAAVITPGALTAELL